MPEEITDARWLDAEHTRISCLIAGVQCTVPAVPGNRNWDDIVRYEIPVAEFE